MHPDFSDEEIRREVCHVGPKEGPEGLELEEKGTVYTEMVSSWDHPWGRAAQPISEALFGPDHPLGGLPGRQARGDPHAGAAPHPAGSRPPRTSWPTWAPSWWCPPGAANEPLLARLDSLLRALEAARPRRGPRCTAAQLPPIRPAAQDPLLRRRGPCARRAHGGARPAAGRLAPGPAPGRRGDDAGPVLPVRVRLRARARTSTATLVDPARAEDRPRRGVDQRLAGRRARPRRLAGPGQPARGAG
jgi:hypothetical protein